MITPINEHNMLTLDFWRDTVTYEGKTVPTGTLGCETLNIPDEVIEKLNELCPRVNLLLKTMNQQTPNAALLPDGIQYTDSTGDFTQCAAVYHIQAEENIGMDGNHHGDKRENHSFPLIFWHNRKHSFVSDAKK